MTPTPLLALKRRPEGFLSPKHVPDEVFDYVRELHDILWRFVHAEYPGASGQLNHWIPPALTTAEHRRLNLEK